MNFKNKITKLVDSGGNDAIKDIIEVNKVEIGLLQNEIYKITEEQAQGFFKSNGSFYSIKFGAWVKENIKKLSSEAQEKDERAKEMKQRLKEIPGWNNLTGNEKSFIEDRLINREINFKKAKKEVENIAGKTSNNNSNPPINNDNSSINEEEKKRWKRLARELNIWSKLTWEQMNSIEQGVDKGEFASYNEVKNKVRQLSGKTTDTTTNDYNSRKNENDNYFSTNYKPNEPDSSNTTVSGENKSSVKPVSSKSKREIIFEILKNPPSEDDPEWDGKNKARSVIVAGVSGKTIRKRFNNIKKLFGNDEPNAFFRQDDSIDYSYLAKWLEEFRWKWDNLEHKELAETEKDEIRDKRRKLRETEGWKSLNKEEKEELIAKVNSGESLEGVKNEVKKAVEEIKSGKRPEKNNKATLVEGSGMKIYNELFIGEKSPILKKFRELMEKYEDLVNEDYEFKAGGVVDKLTDQIDDKVAKLEGFRVMSSNDDQAIKEEIHQFNGEQLIKRKEIIKLLEEVIQEVEKTKKDNNSVPNQSGQKQDDKWLNEIEKIEAEVVKQENNKTEEIEKKIDKFLSEVQEKKSYDELAPILREIEKFHGETAYYNEIVRITKLETRLIELDSKRFCDEFIRNEEVFSDDNEEKGEIISLKDNCEVMEAEEVIQKKEEIKSKVGNKKVNNVFSTLLNSIKSLDARVKIVDRKIKESIKSIKGYQFSSNIFSSNAYMNQKQQAQASLNKLKSLESSALAQTGNKGFFQPKVLIPVALGAVILGVLAVMVIRSQRGKKVTK